MTKKKTDKKKTNSNSKTAESIEKIEEGKDEKIESKNNDSEEKPGKEDEKVIKVSIENSFAKQLKWAVGIMLVVLAIIMIFYGWRYMESEYTYMNLDFQKTQLGDIVFHSTRIPVVDANNQISGSYSVNFRNNPKELEDILIPASPPAFINEKIVYLTIDPEMEACEMNSIAIITLSSFLRDFANLEIEAAISGQEYAEDNGFPYVTCDLNMDNTVLMINSGEETKIEKTGVHCYELTYNNCEIMEVSEKFMIEILREYMSYFKKV